MPGTVVGLCKFERGLGDDIDSNKIRRGRSVGNGGQGNHKRREARIGGSRSEDKSNTI